MEEVAVCDIRDQVMKSLCGFCQIFLTCSLQNHSGCEETRVAYAGVHVANNLSLTQISDTRKPLDSNLFQVKTFEVKVVIQQQVTDVVTYLHVFFYTQVMSLLGSSLLPDLITVSFKNKYLGFCIRFNQYFRRDLRHVCILSS